MHIYNVFHVLMNRACMHIYVHASFSYALCISVHTHVCICIHVCTPSCMFVCNSMSGDGGEGGFRVTLKQKAKNTLGLTDHK